MKIGLIGLGIMGKPMGKNLLKAGYDLTVSNRNKASAEEMMACGGNRAAAARRLGISKTTLWRRMKQYGIDMK